MGEKEGLPPKLEVTRRTVAKLTGAQNGWPFFFDWVAGTTLCEIKDPKTGKVMATGIGHISTIGPAVMVVETPEQILEMVGLDYQRVVPVPRIKKLT